MSVGFIEAISLGLGKELTLLSGFRSTRLTAPFLGEAQVATALSTATTVDGGATITLTAGTFPVGVLVGHQFEVLSGLRTGRRFAILTINGGRTQITTDSAGGPNFTSESWRVLSPADTTMQVENTLDWSNSGIVYVESIRYTYASKTETSLIGVSYESRQRARGRITVVAGSLIAEGDYFTLSDGFGHTYRFEYTKDAFVAPSAVAIEVDNADTATQVRDKTIDAINGVTPFLISAQPIDAAQLELVHDEESALGNVAATENVANAGFLIDAMFGGSIIKAGAKQTHTSLTEVVDYTRDFSSIDRYRRSFLIDYATGSDLNILGGNLGVPRPVEIADDEVYRSLIKIVAYGHRGTRKIFQEVLDVILGAGNYEVFEDGTHATQGIKTADQPVSGHNVVYFRRTQGSETSSVGKAFLDGIVTAPITSTTTVTLPSTPMRVIGARLAPDPLPERLIHFGTGAVGTSNGTTVTAPTNSWSSPRVQAGDLFVILSGPYTGLRGTIASVTGTTVLTLGFVQGCLHSTIGRNFEACDWKIVRPVSSFRRGKPSSERYIEYTGDPGTIIWEAVVAGGASEASDALLVNTAGGGQYLEISTTSGRSCYYRHRARIRPSARARFEVVAGFGGTPSSTSTTGLQWTFEIRDGGRRMCVGMVGTGVAGEVVVGFVNPSTGALVGTTTTFTSAQAWASFAIEKDGSNEVRFFREGELIYASPYASSHFPTVTETELRFGKTDTTQFNGTFRIKQADWQCVDPQDYANINGTNGSLPGAGSRDLLDSGSNNYFVAGDATAPRRRVRITSFNTVNTGKGNPLGEWEVEAFVSANRVTLVGPTTRGATFIGTTLPRRLTIRGQPDAFTFPNTLGHQIVIESGPNAGTYTIAKLLDPVTFDDLSLKTPLTSSVIAGSGIPRQIRTNVLEVTTDFPAPSSDLEVDWHIRPVFGTNAAPITFTVVDTISVAANVVTLLRHVWPMTTATNFTPLIEAEYTTVLSGQAHDDVDRNELDAPDYSMYPFYLMDQWGYIRRVLDDLTVAGVIPNFDALTRDAAGLHINA